MKDHKFQCEKDFNQWGGKQTRMFARVLALICTDQIAKGSLCITDN